jgi:uncharacterized protein YjbI with pentapeptide repeats
VGQKKLVRKAEPPSKRGMAWPRWTGFRGKTVWDFLQLLIVPLMLVTIGLVFSLQQDARQQRVEDQRADAERELAEQRAQDEALQAYLGQMSQLMLDRKLLEAEQGTPLYTLAQARTSTLILRLDSEHNESVTRFLINSGLAVGSEASARLLREITLSHATLSNAYLPNADLRYADLSSANLSDADLSGADLSEANLNGADLSNADLSGTKKVTSYELHPVWDDLRGTNLRGADLSGADLRYADLRHADLHDADLRKANLRGNPTLTDEKIAAAESFEGATMRNGQKYEEWLKSKGIGKD